MAKSNVYITRMIPQPAVDLLREHFDVEINLNNRPLLREELLSAVSGRNAVLCLLSDFIDESVFEAAGPQCRIFANYAVGFNNIDMEAATRHGIAVTNTPDVLTDATADLTWALLFATARRIVESDKYLHTGMFTGWEPMLFLGRDITGKTLGIIGAGRIGTNFAKKSKGFDMKILYYSKKPNAEFENETGAEFVDKETLLKESDFVSLHVPLTPETTHFICERELALMKYTAILINTSRGPVIDEKALVDALRAGQIWGVGLDVYENEPELEQGLTELDNVVLLPHIGSATIETRTNMGLVAARNIIAALGGEIPPNCVNPEIFRK